MKKFNRDAIRGKFKYDKPNCYQVQVQVPRLAPLTLLPRLPREPVTAVHLGPFSTLPRIAFRWTNEQLSNSDNVAFWLAEDVRQMTISR